MDWKQGEKVGNDAVKIPGRWLSLHYYEALNLLFRIENALRVFLYIVLKNQYKDKWAEIQISSEDENEGTISSIAKRRIGQSQTFGYLGHPIACPIMHLTSGEMIRLIISDAYWKYFKEYFLGSKEIIKNKLEEIGTIRNSLAHFRPIKIDDIDVIKQNSKHVLLGIEQFLKQALVKADIIPTNTDDSWYKELKTLGTNLCTFSFYQSKDEQWIKLSVEYNCPVIKSEQRWGLFVNYNVLTIKSTAILMRYQSLRQNVTYLSEQVPYIAMPKDLKPVFRKNISMVFGRNIISEDYKVIKKDIEDMLLSVSKETELIQQDNLARGFLIQSVSTHASSLKDEEGNLKWTIYGYPLRTLVLESDPPEYWGDLNFFGWEDFIAATEKYPWMPEKISEEEVPF